MPARGEDPQEQPESDVIFDGASPSKGSSARQSDLLSGLSPFNEAGQRDVFLIVEGLSSAEAKVRVIETDPRAGRLLRYCLRIRLYCTERVVQALAILGHFLTGLSFVCILVLLVINVTVSRDVNPLPSILP